MTVNFSPQNGTAIPEESGGVRSWRFNPQPKDRSEGPQPTEIKKQIGGVRAFLDLKTGHYQEPAGHTTK